MKRNRSPRERMMETLFNAFANSNDYNVQKREYFWAVEEGFHRVKEFEYSFNISHAQKEHKCMRNCKIQVGDKFFSPMRNWSGGGKLCANCMAMILYYLKVGNLPVFEYDYWDDEKKEPHLANDGEVSRAVGNMEIE